MRADDVERDTMREEYDFSDGVKNPYAESLKTQMTIRIRRSTIDYFKQESLRIGIPYQTLINMYLDDCAAKERKLTLRWD